MRKTFLKVALFSLVAAPMVTSLQSCKDYDDDITEINGTTGTLTNQIANLDGQIQALKTAVATAENEAKNAAKDAENARKQAEKALQDAADAMAAARDAQAAGDAAKAAAEQAKAAAAKAEADAAAALAMANEAKYAAAQAKADAIAEATRQAEALRSDIANLQALLQGKIDANAAGISANAKEIAINAAAIKANVEKLNALEAKIAAIDAKLAMYPTTEAMTKAINDAVEKAQAAVMAELQKTNANIVDINNKLNTLNSLITSEIAKLQSQIDAILADLAKNGGDISSLTAAQQDLLAKYNNLDGQVNALTGRVDVIETDVNGLKADVQTLNTSLAALQATVTDNYADVLAKIAAVETRTTQIETQLQALALYKQELDTKFTEIAGKFSDLENKYTELKTELGNVKGTVEQHTTEIAALTNQLSTLQGEMSTLKNEWTTYKAELDQKIADLDTKITTDLATAKSELETKINTKISELETKFTELETALNTKIDTKLQEVETKLSQLESALNVLNMLPGRLVSVGLIPDLYVSGVPTIEFPNINYQKWTAYAATAAATDKVWGYYQNSSTPVSKITDNQVVVRYQLNPESITKDNVKLDGLQFVSHKAVSRAEDNSPLSIVKSSIANGELCVTVENKAVGNLSNRNAATNKPEITVAALKVPIADKYLYPTEAKTGAVVYSDYARVAEREIYNITAVPAENPPYLFATRAQMTADYANGNYVVTKQVYNETLDLNTCVRVQYSGTYYASIAEAKEQMGLTAQYKLIQYGANEDYKYAKLDGSVLSSVIPAGKTVNDVLGKTPIIQVVLKAPNGDVVDVRYFQVKFISDITLDPIVINEPARHIGATQKTVGNLQGWNYAWAGKTNSMAADVLAKVAKDAPITAAQFQTIYGNPTISTVLTYQKADGTKGTDNTITGMMSYSATGKNALTFLYHRSNLAQIWAFGTSQTFTNTVTFTPGAAYTNLYPEVTIIYNFVIDVPEAFKPTLGEYNDIYWTEKNNVQTILAVPSKPVAGGHPSYMTELFKGRTFPYVVFDKEAKDSLYTIAQFNLTKVVEKQGNVVTNAAASVTSDVMNVNDAAAATPIFDVTNTANGQALVNKEATVKVDWNVYPIGSSSVVPNQVYPIQFAQTAVEFVKPLTVNVDATKSLAITDATKSTEIDIETVLSITDYYGNKNCMTDATLKAFYDIKAVNYTDIEIDGKPASESNIKLSVVNGKLLYDATDAPAIVNDKVIEIKFNIPHYWGVLNAGTYGEPVQTIKVTLKKK